MNSNPGIQNVGTVAWDGTASFSADVSKFVRFGWVFQVVGALANNVIFNIQSAPPSEADPCVPGAFIPVPEVSICDQPAVPAAQATIVIPAGTAVGTICSGTIPCKPNAFVRIVPTVPADAANIRVVLIRQGPMI